MTVNPEKRISKTWVYAIYWIMPLLYFVVPSTGKSNDLITKVGDIYLQYESLLSGIMVVILSFAVLGKTTWQHIHILDKAENLMIFSTVASTILVRQINSAWITNLLWFAILGMMCIVRWYLWTNFSPVSESRKESCSFLPVKAHNQLMP